MTDEEYLALSPEEAGRYWKQQQPDEQKRLLSLHLTRLKEPPPQPLRRGPRASWLVGAVLISAMVIWGAVSCMDAVRSPRSSMTKAEEYPAPWVRATPAVFLPIYRSGHACTEGYVRSSAKNDGEFLVFCHDPERRTWTSFLVWKPSDRVLGPDLTFAYTGGVPLPQRDPNEVWLDTAK